MSNKKSTRQENQIAKDLSGGKRQPGSGCFDMYKHDCISDSWLLEAKYKEPTTKSFSVSKLMFKQLTDEAFKEGKLPAMVIDFLGGSGIKVAIIRYEEFLELDKMLNKEYNEN